MPAPYSIDLRKRIINAYEQKKGSQRQLSKRFQVSLSSVKSLIWRYRNTGKIQAKPHAGGAKPVINSSQLNNISCI